MQHMHVENKVQVDDFLNLNYHYYFKICRVQPADLIRKAPPRENLLEVTLTSLHKSTFSQSPCSVGGSRVEAEIRANYKRICLCQKYVYELVYETFVHDCVLLSCISSL